MRVIVYHFPLPGDDGILLPPNKLAKSRYFVLKIVQHTMTPILFREIYVNLSPTREQRKDLSIILYLLQTNEGSCHIAPLYSECILCHNDDNLRWELMNVVVEWP